MELFIKNFKELTLDELYDILQLRVNIFVVEQECPYPECDGYDKIATHLFFTDNSKIIAYTRILPPSSRYKEPSIGRVIVDSEQRGTGLGYKIMNESIGYIKKEYQSNNIKIQAQVYLEKFYCSLGFKKISEEYLEDDIPHIDMILNN
jgi:ElaA protein